MLIGLKQYTYKKERKVAILSTTVFFILALILYIVLLQGGVAANDVELPLIYIINKFGKAYQYIYGIVVVSAIYTSAIAAGYGLAENCSKSKKMYRNICITICTSAILISKIGFSYLVNLLYPVFGLLGLIQIICIIFRRPLI